MEERGRCLLFHHKEARKPGKVEDWNNGMTKTKNRGQVSTFNKRDDGMMV